VTSVRSLCSLQPTGLCAWGAPAKQLRGALLAALNAVRLTLRAVATALSLAASLCDTEEEEVKEEVKFKEARRKIEREQSLLPVESVSGSRLRKSHVRLRKREKLRHGWNF